MSKLLRKQFLEHKFHIIKTMIKNNIEYSNLLKAAKDVKVLLPGEDDNEEDSKYDELLNRLIDAGLHLFKDLILQNIPDAKEIYKEIENIFVEMLLLHDESYKLEPFNEILLKYSNIQLNVIKSSYIHNSYSSCMDIYSMQSKGRGVLFLVNNINFQHQKKRSGAQYDKYYLISLYRGMGFKVYYFENLKKHDFKSYVEDLINSHLYDVDCLVLAILTHGKGSNEAIFYDENVMAIEDILYYFSDTYCPVLKGKPKIFLFPFCRGVTADIGIRNIQLSSVEPDGKIRKPVWADIIVCYGSVDGYQTLREPATGSWFVREFCKILANQAHKEDFETMLYNVKSSVMSLRPGNQSREDYLQTPSIVSIDFNKILYFNPGYFENNL